MKNSKRRAKRVMGIVPGSAERPLIVVLDPRDQMIRLRGKNHRRKCLEIHAEMLYLALQRNAEARSGQMFMELP